MASIYRTVGQSLDLAQAILTPRLTDNRFNGQEQDKIAAALGEIARCRCMLPYDTNVMQEAERAGCSADLTAQIALISPLIANKTLQAWEYYNALDLLTDAADDVLNGVAGRSSDLG
jgi:hypothetical protein